jgi:hypothetical protein
MEITIDKYTTLKLEDGQYGVKLIEGWVGREGDFKPSFCKREFKKGSGDKTAPVSVKLGDRAKAIEVARAILTELGEDAPF